MIQLKVNGESRTFEGDPQMPLLWYLRDKLELTGTKFGCGMALVRRLYRPPGRPCGALLRNPDERGRWQRSGHHRGHFAERPASGAAEVDRIQRPAMRLLPVRADHAGHCASQREAQADRSGHRHGHGGKHLPLWNLPADSGGDQSGRGRNGMNSTISNVSRRGFMKGLVSSGALVLSVRLLPEALWAEKGGTAVEAIPGSHVDGADSDIPRRLSESTATAQCGSWPAAPRWAPPAGRQSR